MRTLWNFKDANQIRMQTKDANQKQTVKTHIQMNWQRQKLWTMEEKNYVGDEIHVLYTELEEIIVKQKDEW